MPRIDPLQLLKCLSVLLNPESGGILSREEVPRLVNLMTKFSKKLVSKCVYILILKNTEQSLVDMFMAEGGWNLIHTWLQDSINISNWDLVKEILSLLLITPVDVERLKLNNIPKLVKSLSRLEEVKGVQELSAQLVHDWLIIVKGNTKVEEAPKIQPAEQPVNVEPIKTDKSEVDDETVLVSESNTDTVDSSQIKASENVPSETISTDTFYKVSVRDGKQVISRTASVESSSDEATLTEPQTEAVITTEAPEIIDVGVKKETKDKKSDDKNKMSEKEKSKSKSHSSSSKHSSSSSNKKSSGSKDRHKSSSSSSSKSSSRDKDKERDRDREKDRKDRHKANGAKSSSSSSKSSNIKEKDSKEDQAEKDKDTLAKIRPQSIDKLGRIPKKTDDKTKENKEVKKPTMSIEIRKSSEERPKTVKVFNSKRRSTGLEEEAKPPPPRPTKKPSVSLPTIPQKRPSPVKDLLSTPPEKKFKMELPERPGAIKLIPPKPKPPVLQESDIFMDALTASATTKKEPKKRKRRPSVTKDTPGSPTKEEPQTPTSPTTSPIGLKIIAAPNFYQDTLQTEEVKPEVKTEVKEETEEIPERSGTPIESDVDIKPRTEGALKGALVYTKKKGPKKSVKFNDDNLTQIRYFELDETERVNVTRTFMDMAKMEMTSEREALQLSRKLPNEDIMEPQTMWRLLFIIDQPDPLVVPGCKSLEKDIQFAREKSVLQALYFDKRKIPDSPEEPIPENHQMSDPITIPLEDSESQEMDLRNTPWPEPKGSPPPMQENLPPQIFSNVPMPFQTFQHGAPPAFQGMPPRFGPQNGPGVFHGPPNMMPNGNMMGPPNLGPPPDMMHQGSLNPNAFGPGPDNFNNPMMGDNNYQMPFNPPNMGMFPPNNFNMNRGGGRGGFRRGGNNGPWIRMNGPGPGNWPNRGGGRGRLCKNVKNHGFCRNMDKCPFIHPK